MKSIDVIVVTDFEGFIKPIRFRVEEDGEYQVVRVKRLLFVDKLRDYLVYKVECSVNCILKKIELRFYNSECKWYLM